MAEQPCFHHRIYLLVLFSNLSTPGGRSQTTWTNFRPILTTYLPIVDFRGHLVHHLPLVHVDIEKPDHLLTPYVQYVPSFKAFTKLKKISL